MNWNKLFKPLAVLAVLSLGFVNLTATGAAKWANPDLLVSPDTVKQNINKANWIVVDCRDLKDYAKGHIPGAISLGKRCKKALRDSTARVWRDTNKYEKLFGKVGISNNTHVVFYYGDMKTLTDATVGFWIMEYLGHDKVYVLNGGLDAWRKAGNRLDKKPVKKSPATFKAKLVSARYAPTDEIASIARGKITARQVIDSRTEKEYAGKDIRAIRGGYIPNTTMNVSHLDTLKQVKNPKTGKMEAVAYFDPEPVEKAFGKLDKMQRTIAYCQTGTRSTMTYMQLRLMGFKDPANWDESWRVYGSQLALPVAGEQWYNFAGLNKKLKKLEKKVAKLEGKK
ncbi:MAG: rhodanese-like domain-containing protein [Gammaproteobacteria bacterium]|nr:rhodanese-like domain-containing protein [Gammaproteobacteria bacterium]